MASVVERTACPELGPICYEREEPPVLTSQRLLLTQLTGFAEVSLGRWLGVRLEAPFRLVRTTVSYSRPGGEDFWPDWEDIHHRDQTLAGPGDPLVFATASIRPDEGGRWGALNFRLGTTVPLGRTWPDPFDAGSRGLSHEHLQLGTGTWMPAAELSFSRPFGPVQATLTGRALLAVAQNRHGYRPGHRFLSAASASTPIGGGFVGTALFEGWAEGAERWGGTVRGEGNMGRVDLLVGAGVSRRLGGLPVSLFARAPVWRHLVGEQLTYPLILELTFSG